MNFRIALYGLPIAFRQSSRFARPVRTTARSLLAIACAICQLQDVPVISVARPLRNLALPGGLSGPRPGRRP
jgi:hypothetical protein